MEQADQDLTELARKVTEYMEREERRLRTRHIVQERVLPWIFVIAVVASAFLWEWLAKNNQIPGILRNAHPLLVGFVAISLLVVLVIAVYQTWAFLLTPTDERRRRLSIIASDYGTDSAWYVEYQGRRLALVSDPKFVDMFWYSYRIDILTQDADEAQRLLTDQAWWLRGEFVFRSRELDEVASSAFASYFPEPGRIMMRALYLHIGETWLWERIATWWFRRKRKPSQV